MGKRGPTAIPDEIKALRGTARADRAHPRTVPVLHGDLRIPTWLEGHALELWREKTARYRERGLSVVGCESMLAQYCAYEAMTIECWQAYYRWDPTDEYMVTYRATDTAGSLNHLAPRRSKNFLRPPPPSAAQENALKNLAGQFYDTPSTQVSKQAVGPQSEADAFWDQFTVVNGGKGAA